MLKQEHSRGLGMLDQAVKNQEQHLQGISMRISTLNSKFLELKQSLEQNPSGTQMENWKAAKIHKQRSQLFSEFESALHEIKKDNSNLNTVNTSLKVNRKKKKKKRREP